VQAAASALREFPLTTIFSSPRQRAQETANIIQAHHSDLVINTTDLLDEVYSPFDGTANHEMMLREYNLYSGVGAPYEQPVDIVQRTQKFIKTIQAIYNGQQVAAVTHGDIIAFLILWAKGLPIEAERRNKLQLLGVADTYPATASLTSLIFETDHGSEKPRVEYLRPYPDNFA
jgi:broad specificity phosphatase PhoE